MPLTWTGSHDIRVIGGSKHQPDLEDLCNRFTNGRAEAICLADLVREPNDLVRVEIEERTVSFLSRVEGAEYCRGLRAMGKGDEIVSFGMAMIANDGFDPNERFMLNLDLKWPVEELPA